MLLQFSNGQPFATGAAIYDYSPIPGSDLAARLILQVKVEEQLVSAILDTGAPYLICSPSLAHTIGFDPNSALSEHVMFIRGYRVRGGLHRANLILLCNEGDDLLLEATAFLPEPDEHFEFPTFVGLLGCLEWIRFAVDPSDTTFYFGSYS